MRVLSVCSSGALQTVALLERDVVVAERARPFKRRQPRRLLQDISDALAEVNWAASGLDLLVGDVGPGSFTGIRAGLATLRALAFAHDLPVAGVGAHELAAAAWRGADNGASARVLLQSRAGVAFVATVHAGDWRADAVSEVRLDGLAAPGEAVVADPWVAAQLPAAWQVEAVPPTAAAVRHLLPRLEPAAWATLVPRYIGRSDAERNLGIAVDASAIASVART